MLTLKATQEGQVTRQTITDEQGRVIAIARYWNWPGISVADTDVLLTQQLHGAGYTWKDVDQN